MNKTMFIYLFTTYIIIGLILSVIVYMRTSKSKLKDEDPVTEYELGTGLGLSMNWGIVLLFIVIYFIIKFFSKSIVFFLKLFGIKNKE